MPTQNNNKMRQRISPAALAEEVVRCLRQSCYRQDKLFRQRLSAWQASIDGNIHTQHDADTAICALLESLNDGYSFYLEAKAQSAIKRTRAHNLHGIGVLIEAKRTETGAFVRNRYGKQTPQSVDGYPVLFEVFEGSPAFLAGLAKGDLILSINEKTTRQLSLTTIIDRLRGREDSRVRLAVR